MNPLIDHGCDPAARGGVFGSNSVILKPLYLDDNRRVVIQSHEEVRLETESDTLILVRDYEWRTDQRLQAPTAFALSRTRPTAHLL